MEEIKSATSFLIAGEHFAFETDAIRHILEVVPQTRVPLAKPCICGIINHHGVMVPVVDLRILIGKEPVSGLLEQCIVIVGIPDGTGKEEQVGFLVDEMDDVFEYSSTNFDANVVIDVNPDVQRAIAGTINFSGKFIYLIKTLELSKSLE